MLVYLSAQFGTASGSMPPLAPHQPEAIHKWALVPVIPQTFQGGELNGIGDKSKKTSPFQAKLGR